MSIGAKQSPISATVEEICKQTDIQTRSSQDLLPLPGPGNGAGPILTAPTAHMALSII